MTGRRGTGREAAGGRARPIRRVLVVLAAAVALVGSVGTTADALPPPGPRPAVLGPGTYRPPLVAPVADPFRPPPEPWLAGNRGIEYRTAPGSSVGSIGPGLVAFAGSVAGQRIVTVDHPDGLRSSYVDLAWIAVEVGDRVEAGQLVGRATDRLHLGVRRGTTYLDPAGLWGTTSAAGRVVLVPLEPSDGGAGAVAGGRRGGEGRPPRLGPAELVGPAIGLAVARSLGAHPA